MKHKGKIIVCAALVLAVGVAALVFYRRPPVLVLSDEPFTFLYGTRRTKMRQMAASLALGRRVKQVLIDDAVGTDLMVLALEEAEPRPWRAVFPYRYAEGALRYHEQYPDIPTILLYGRDSPDRRTQAAASNLGESALFFEFSTDRKLDLYRTGRFAAALAREKTGIIPVFINRSNMNAGKDAFLQGFGSDIPELEAQFFETIARFNLSGDFPLVVIAGSGSEYLDRNPKSPLILFTWLDPSFTSKETLIIMDDSVWAQLGDALKMVKEGKKSGLIPSKPLIFSARIADNKILRDLKKAARSAMEGDTEPSLAAP